MSDRNPSNDPKRPQRPGPERVIEGFERLLLDRAMIPYLTEKLKREAPEELAKLRRLERERRIPDTMEQEGVFHGLARLAIFRACEKNSERVLGSEAEMEAFRNLVDETLFELLSLMHRLSKNERQAIAAADPHVQLFRLIAAHQDGTLPRGRFVDAFQSPASHSIAMSIITAAELKKQFPPE